MKWWNQTKTFLAEVRAEISKTYFPGRREVINTTGVVLVSSFIFAVFLYASDVVITFVLEQIFSLGG